MLLTPTTRLFMHLWSAKAFKESFKPTMAYGTTYPLALMSITRSVHPAMALNAHLEPRRQRIGRPRFLWAVGTVHGQVAASSARPKMSFLLGPEDHSKEDLTKELASGLPRLVRWVPTVAKASHRGFTRWRLARKMENQVTLQPLDARIDVRASDQATISLSLVVANFSKRVCEPDRLELDSIVVGGRSLQRNSDMIKVRSAILPRSAMPLWFAIDLRGSDVRDLIQGISKASNGWSSPQASVRIYGEILFIARSERFRKPVNFQWDWATCNVVNGVPEAIG